MTFPTIEEVESADRYQLCSWHRFLRSPATPEEIAVQKRIYTRYEEEGGMNPEISKKLGWKLVTRGKAKTVSSQFHETSVIVDGREYRIGHDSVYLSLQNSQISGWVLYDNYPHLPRKIGGEVDNKEFKIYMKDVLVFSNKK